MTKPSRKRSRPTQLDIARLAGVSQATVSMVINGGASAQLIKESTREAVVAAAAELKYTVNPAARSLRGGRNHLLGLYTFENVFPTDDRDFYYPFLLGVEEECAERGYDLLLFTSAGRGERSLADDRLQRMRMADGCVMLGRHVRTDDLEQLAAEHFPFVFIGRRQAPGTTIPFVAPDYVQATTELIGHLVGLGHRRMVYLRQPEDSEPTTDRLNGLHHAIEEYGLDPDEIRIETLASSAELTEQRVRDWVADGATALLIEPSEDHTLVAALDALTEGSSLAVPGDVSIALLGEPPSWEPSHLDWTRFALPREEIARRAVQTLIAMLDDAEPRQTFVPCTLVVGDSCAPPGPSTGSGRGGSGRGSRRGKKAEGAP
ncbi:MAG TPA: LacI family DNA-binding transcriptional regulator [Microlunatus sp.]|nr:LacI family DNA-binding transcriptional regulator [Microlunatus sp.]